MNNRPRKSPSEWQALIHQHANSGQSVSEFCREQALTESSFYKWQARFKKEVDGQSSGFSQVSVTSPRPSNKICCVLPTGLRLEWDESTSLTALVPMLKALS